jgi:L-threonylcarbamoyladenylate synthase
MGVLQLQTNEGAKTLRNGGVIASPTDTVYGQGANAFNPAAVQRIYEMKERPKYQPFRSPIADVEQLTALGDPIPSIAWFLARRFWASDLTMALSKKDSLPARLNSGAAIAIRVPNYPVCQALMKSPGNDINGTSANTSGQTVHSTARAVGQQLGRRVAPAITEVNVPAARSPQL